MAINRLNPDYPDAGLVQVSPTSVAVGSGSGSVDGNGTVTFSGASSVSLNNCFSSTYTNYRLIFIATGSTFAGCYFQTRLSGTTATGANYSYQKLGAVGSTVSASRGTGSTTIELGYLRSGGADGWTVDVFAPNLAEPTKTIHHCTDWGDGTNLELYFGVGFHFVSTAYDGFTLFPNSGTFSGSLQVYGYRK